MYRPPQENKASHLLWSLWTSGVWAELEQVGEEDRTPATWCWKVQFIKQSKQKRGWETSTQCNSSPAQHHPAGGCTLSGVLQQPLSSSLGALLLSNTSPDRYLGDVSVDEDALKCFPQHGLSLVLLNKLSLAAVHWLVFIPHHPPQHKWVKNRGRPRRTVWTAFGTAQVGELEVSALHGVTGATQSTAFHWERTTLEEDSKAAGPGTAHARQRRGTWWKPMVIKLPSNTVPVLGVTVLAMVKAWDLLPTVISIWFRRYSHTLQTALCWEAWFLWVNHYQSSTGRCQKQVQ